MSLANLVLLGARLAAKSLAPSARPAAACMKCGGSLAGGDVTFDCCGFRACPGCAREHYSPLPGGEVLVECRCGEVRRSRFRQ